MHFFRPEKCSGPDFPGADQNFPGPGKFGPGRGFSGFSRPQPDPQKMVSQDQKKGQKMVSQDPRKWPEMASPDHPSGPQKMAPDTHFSGLRPGNLARTRKSGQNHQIWPKPPLFGRKRCFQHFSSPDTNFCQKMALGLVCDASRPFCWLVKAVGSFANPLTICCADA